MNHHTLKSYDRRLESLTDSILQMGALVKDMVRVAGKSLMEQDPKLVDFAIATDKQINALDRQIEQQATEVLALQNPMAIDLRFVTSSLKIATALERAGDLAKNTTKRSVKLSGYKSAPIMKKIDKMVELCVNMIDEALDSVKSRNPEKATEVWLSDQGVDDLYHDILTAMQEEMNKDPKNILSCTHLVFAAKNFERIADYATNLAKTVHYVTSGMQPDKATLHGDKPDERPSDLH